MQTLIAQKNGILVLGVAKGAGGVAFVFCFVESDLYAALGEAATAVGVVLLTRFGYVYYSCIGGCFGVAVCLRLIVMGAGGEG